MLPCITAASWQLPVTESIVLPPILGRQMKISDKYRSKALDCEKQEREATDYDIKCAWSAIAIEWHSLASRTAEGASQDRESENIS